MEVDLGLDRYPAIVTEASRCWNLSIAQNLVSEDATASGVFGTDAQRVTWESSGIIAKCSKRIPAGCSFKLGEETLDACFVHSPISNFIAGSISMINVSEFLRL